MTQETYTSLLEQLRKIEIKIRDASGNRYGSEAEKATVDLDLGNAESSLKGLQTMLMTIAKYEDGIILAAPVAQP